MPRYVYQAMTTSGSKTRGSLDADSPGELVERLRSMGYFPTKVDEAAPGDEARRFFGLRLSRGVSRQEVEFFTFQVATLVNSGVPLDRALRVCSEQIAGGELRRIIEEVRYDVEHGASFADALAKHPKQFNDLYTNMVRAGQAGGVLGLVLDRVADFARQQRELRDSVASALIYPVILLVFAAAIIAVLMLLVIPRFVTMFEDVGVDLPIYTRALIALVGYLRSAYGVVWVGGPVPLPGATLIALIVVAVGLRQYARTDRGRRAFDRFRMRIPLVGKVIENLIIVRLTQTLSTLLENGVQFLPALRIGKDTTGSVLYRDAVATAETEVERGGGLSGPLKESGLFPPIVTDMLAIGEESGKPEVMLSQLARYYDLEIRRAVERLVAALGPALILFMAGIVVFIALSIVLPIFNLSQALAR